MSLQGSFVQIFTDVVAGTVNQIPFDLRPGNYEALIFRFSGTSLVGAFDPSDVGTLELNDGRPLTRCQFSFLDDFAQMKGGTVDRTAANPGAFNWYVPYDFHWTTDDLGIYNVPDNQNVRAQILPVANLATVMGANSLTITVFGVFKDGVQPYRLQYNRQDFDIVSGRIEEPLNFENIIAVYIENNTNIDRLLYFQDGEQVIDAQRDPLISLVHDDNKLETFSGTFPLLELNFNRSDDITDVKNESNIVQIEGTGTATVTFTVVSIDYTPVELAATAQFRQLQKLKKSQDKANKGKTRPLEVDQQLAASG